MYKVYPAKDASYYGRMVHEYGVVSCGRSNINIRMNRVKIEAQLIKDRFCGTISGEYLHMKRIKLLT